MNNITRNAIDTWRTKWAIPYPNWRQPRGLECYARFIGCYGFQVHNGYGWTKVHTLSFATTLLDHRKHSGNWKGFWKDRQYSK